MARPLNAPGWEPHDNDPFEVRPRLHGLSSQRRRSMPELRRLVGPMVLLVIAGAAIALLGGLTDAAQPNGSTPAATPLARAAAQAGASTSPADSSPSPASGPASPPVSPPPAASPTTPVAPSASPATPSPAASPSRPPNAAPATAEEFEAAGEVVVDIAFPIKPGVRYRYRNNWLHRRDGAPEDYNHARGLRRGRVVRAHDGIDIYAPRGAPVVAPFAGLVIDPAERWQPWSSERYGETVVILSQEPASEGYVALLSHLDVAFVEPGTVVRRGEVIGLNGDSGNAEESPPHVHFELRAPFMLAWEEAGTLRLVDAFNPYASLRAADPREAD
jgi:murein DD-endopeptidase MepM/ murein hydrolase activator NlpD